MGYKKIVPRGPYNPPVVYPSGRNGIKTDDIAAEQKMNATRTLQEKKGLPTTGDESVNKNTSTVAKMQKMNAVSNLKTYNEKKKKKKIF